MNLRFFIRGLAAGMMISIGAVAYVIASLYGQMIAGALLFAVGILVVMEFKFLLFTGFVPNQRENLPKGKYLIQSFVVFVSNLLGAGLMSLMIRFTRIWNMNVGGVSFSDKVSSIMATKLDDNLLSIFILSILCGLIIAMIVRAKTFKNNVIYTALLIMVFIICGYEHVVANSFYITITLKLFTGKGLLFMLINLLGNFVGGFIYSYVWHLEENKNMVC